MSQTNSRRVHALTAAAASLGAMLFATALRAQDAAPDAAKVTAGEALFNGTQLGACWACHGKAGKGTSNAPKLADAKRAWLDSDGSLEAIKGTITTGVAKPKKFPGAMPPMGGGKYTPEQVDQLAAYVYSLSHAGAKKK
jgi:mono/diheme cytochrome c family protein